MRGMENLRLRITVQRLRRKWRKLPINNLLKQQFVFALSKRSFGSSVSRINYCRDKLPILLAHRRYSASALPLAG